jgi:hypothetical protein
MHNSFISIVGVINTLEDIDKLPSYLDNLYKVLSTNFTDYEIILVNNIPARTFDREMAPLDEALKHNIFLLNLSSTINRNHAIIAGLDRANGDYTIIFEFDFYQKPELVLDLFEESRKGIDIVYLRANRRAARARFRLLYKIFYSILKNYSSLKIDEMAHSTRIISRRALNSLLRLRENLRYMKAIYSIVGYRTSFLEVDVPLKEDPNSNFNDKFRTSLVAITSFTTFLRSLLLWIFIFSMIFLFAVVTNAVMVKFMQVDLFGDYHETVPGWTFLVVVISIFFAITCLNLYIMSIYLSNIYQEMKHRPLYILESVKRF